MIHLMRLGSRCPKQINYMIYVGFQRPAHINGLSTSDVCCTKMTGNTTDNLKPSLKQPVQNFRTSPPLSRQTKLNVHGENTTIQHRNSHPLLVDNKKDEKYILSRKSPSSPNPPTSEQGSVGAYDVKWVFLKQKTPSKLWLITSQFIITLVGLFSKFVLVFMNRTRVHNLERLVKAVNTRPKGQPLVTVSNHHSCFDDPGLWGVLPFRFLCNTFKIRWSMAAHDICFTNFYHAIFFMYGKCIPVVRGLGVYQDAVDLCIQKCALGHWVHVFPEGKVNMTKEEMRLKWGVGRIIYESPRIPLILPMWHEGMDEVLPNVEPYILKWGRKVTLNIGEPLDLNDFIQSLKNRSVPEPEARKLITDKIQDAFKVIRMETEALHKKHIL